MEQAKIMAKNKDASVAPSFTVDDVLKFLGTDFLDDDYCRLWILTKLHPEEQISCPECYTALPKKSLPRFWNGRRLRCSNCGKFFSALTKTFLSGCHLQYTGIILLAMFLGLQVPSNIIAEKLGISSESVRLWRQKFQAIERMKDMKAIEGGHV